MSASRLIFPEAEYRARLRRAQEAMQRHGLAAIWVTTETDINYFTGFLTRFWASPSRPWFVILPVEGDPIAIIPEIGAPLMARGWVRDIRTWPAPRPEDDGVSLLVEALSAQRGPIGMPQGPESHLRMPMADFMRVQAACSNPIGPDKGIVAGLRAIKSRAEIDCLREVCAVAGRAFDRVTEVAAETVPLSHVFRGFQRLLLEEGADWVGFLAGAAGPDGYEDVISPADERPLQKGDVLMLDTGAVLHGYYSDFDRNFAIGAASPVAREAHGRLVEAVEAGLEAARPGMRACDVWRAMIAVTGPYHGPHGPPGAKGAKRAEARARLGHGLGLHLTEGLSFLEGDTTVLRPGMVLTLEPSMPTRDGRIMVHEEVIAVTETGPEKLTTFSGPDLPVI
ncbi:MAG: Xaa-Pro peptidase family protein [Pseudomonadota bacterium]